MTQIQEKSSFKMLGLTFSSKLDWGSCITSIAKTASRKIGALICNCLGAKQGNLIYQTDFVFLAGTNIAKINKIPLSNFPIMSKYLFKSRIMIIWQHKWMVSYCHYCLWTSIYWTYIDTEHLDQTLYNQTNSKHYNWG